MNAEETAKWVGVIEVTEDFNLNLLGRNQVSFNWTTHSLFSSFKAALCSLIN